MKHEITNEQPFAWFLRVWQGRLINQLERERERENECNVVSVRLKRGRNVPRRVSSPVSSKSLSLVDSLSLSLFNVQFNSIVWSVSFHRLDHEIPPPSPPSKGIERASSFVSFSFEWRIDGWKEGGLYLLTQLSVDQNVCDWIIS